PGILVLPEHSTSDVHQPTEPPSFSLQDLPDDDTPAGRVDSIWEIPLELARTVRI
ncbi:MAG: hypothetical protein RLZZ232_974, partial [Planctomycetota bacterium]